MRDFGNRVCNYQCLAYDPTAKFNYIILNEDQKQKSVTKNVENSTLIFEIESFLRKKENSEGK